MMSLDMQLEALLFYKATPQKKQDILRLLETNPAELAEACETIRDRQQDSALALIETDHELQLATRPELSDLIAYLKQQEQSQSIGKAGAETLAIVLYEGPVSRAAIDRIRGVNSAQIIRTLQVRGLIARQNNQAEHGQRYIVTSELLAHLGVERVSDLPDHQTVTQALATFHKQHATT